MNINKYTMYENYFLFFTFINSGDFSTINNINEKENTLMVSFNPTPTHHEYTQK